MKEGIDYIITETGAVRMQRELTVSDFCEMLDTFEIPGVDAIDVMIVKIKYKYSHETEWTIDNEIIMPEFGYTDYECHSWAWLNDWDEGQQEQYVLGWMLLSDVDICSGVK